MNKKELNRYSETLGKSFENRIMRGSVGADFCFNMTSFRSGTLLLLLSTVLLATASTKKGQKSVEDLDWWQKTVVYQIYPRSMQDTDADGVGDLKGITSKLGHLTDIGVDTFWISPIYTSPMKDFGYDISNYTDVDPLFGTLDDFKTLVAEARKRNQNVVLDFVPNHSSDEHPWFNKSRNREGNYTDYYVWADGIGPNKTDPPNNWISCFDGPAWTYDETRGQFYLHEFLAEQPDLNYRSEHVRFEMLNVLKFWLDLGVDGFRVDAVMYLFEDEQLRDEPRSNNTNAQPGTHDYLDHIYTAELEGTFDAIREWRALLNDYEGKDGKHRLMMVEVYDTLPQTMRYFGNDSFPLADFPFNFQLINLNRNSTGTDIYNLVSSWIAALPEGRWGNWVLGNHDNHRIANRTHVDLVDGFNMINLLLGGTPVTYYGEEIGMVDVFIPYNETQDPEGKDHGPDDYWKYSRDFERTPMQWNNHTYSGFSTARPWLRVGSDYPNTNVDKEIANPTSHLSIYKTLVELHNESAILLGTVYYPIYNDVIFSFAKVIPGDSTGYVVIMSLARDTLVAVDLVNSGCCNDFNFPTTGKVVVQRGNLTEEVSLSPVIMGPRDSVVIRFEPIFH